MVVALRMFNQLVLVLEIIIFHTSMGRNDFPCDEGFTPGYGSCYKFFYKPSTWKEAEAVCMDHNAHLVTINDRYEAAYIKAKYKTSFWCGLNDMERENEFVWVDGSNSTYRKWHRRSRLGERWAKDCVMLWYLQGSHFMADLPCERRLSFLCESKSKGQCHLSFFNELNFGSCYFAPHNTYYNWKSAEAHCKKYDSELITISDKEEYHYFAELRSRFWTGINGKDIDDSDTSSFTSLPWVYGLPSTEDLKNNCVEQFYDSGMNIRDCSEKSQFICEAPASLSECDALQGRCVKDDVSSTDGCNGFFDKNPKLCKNDRTRICCLPFSASCSIKSIPFLPIDVQVNGTEINDVTVGTELVLQCVKEDHVFMDDYNSTIVLTCIDVDSWSMKEIPPCISLSNDSCGRDSFPALPGNVEILDKPDEDVRVGTTLELQCVDKEYVFPDSNYQTKKFTCEKIDTWSISNIPSCIPLLKVLDFCSWDSLPALPANVEVLDKQEENVTVGTTLELQCANKEHVFPDSIYWKKKIKCDDVNTWSIKDIPSCIPSLKDSCSEKSFPVLPANVEILDKPGEDVSVGTTLELQCVDKEHVFPDSNYWKNKIKCEDVNTWSIKDIPSCIPSLKVPSCEDINCNDDGACVLEEVQCLVPPCHPTPICVEKKVDVEPCKAELHWRPDAKPEIITLKNEHKRECYIEIKNEEPSTSGTLTIFDYNFPSDKNECTNGFLIKRNNDDVMPKEDMMCGKHAEDGTKIKEKKLKDETMTIYIYMNGNNDELSIKLKTKSDVTEDAEESLISSVGLEPCNKELYWSPEAKKETITLNNEREGQCFIEIKDGDSRSSGELKIYSYNFPHDEDKCTNGFLIQRNDDNISKKNMICGKYTDDEPVIKEKKKKKEVMTIYFFMDGSNEDLTIKIRAKS